MSCRTCHRLKEVSPTGAVLWKASAQVCSMCHEAVGGGAAAVVSRGVAGGGAGVGIGARSAPARPWPSAKLPEDRAAAIAKELDRLQSDLEFVRKGNDIHNIHYASKLTRALLEQCRRLCRELKAPEPKVVLPPAEKQ